MRVIIPCGGDGKRWNDYGNVPKALINIDGEPILKRTIRLCQRFTDDIWVVATDDRINDSLSDVNVSIDPGKVFKIPVGTDKVMCTEDLWLSNQDTVVLFGDTYFTQESINLMLEKNTEMPLIFFGRLRASELTRKKGAPEIYGLRIRPDGQELLRTKCENIRTLKTPGPGYVFTKTDRMLTVLDSLGYEYFQEINDFTEDFDRPKDLLNWIRGRGGRLDTWADVDIVIPTITSIPERVASLNQLVSDLNQQCPGATIHVIEQTYSDPPDWLDVYAKIVDGTRNVSKAWVLFFEDDAQIAPDFGERALKTMKMVNSDCEVISFFSLDEGDEDRLNQGVRMYQTGNFGFSQGLALRFRTAKDWFNTNWVHGKNVNLQPDITLRNICNTTGRKIMVRLPNLVQHQSVPSVLNPSRPSSEYPVSKTFGKPD